MFVFLLLDVLYGSKQGPGNSTRVPVVAPSSLPSKTKTRRGLDCEKSVVLQCGLALLLEAGGTEGWGEREQSRLHALLLNSLLQSQG